MGKIKKGIKNAEFHADFKSVENFFKKFTKKVVSKISLTNTSKRRKSAYFHHIFADNIFGTFLKNFFNRFEMGVKFCVFDTFLIFSNQIFLKVILILFSNFEAKRAKNGSKILKTFFINMS